NTLKTIWKRGEAVVHGWLSIPSAFSAEVMAHQGFDSLTVDMQHGVVDYQVAVTMLQAVSTTPVIPLARVPWNDPARLMKILDAGVYGVICPMISTRAQAEALVAACKYPPRGYRSFGPVRASLYAGIHNATAAYALRMITAGYQFVTLASDSRFLAARAAEEVAAVRKTGVKAGKLPAY